MICGNANCDDDQSHDSESEDAICNVDVTDDDGVSQQAMMVDLNVVGSNDFPDTPTFNNNSVTMSNCDGYNKGEALPCIVISEYDSTGTNELDDSKSKDVIVDTSEGNTIGVNGRLNANGGSISTFPTLPSLNETLASQNAPLLSVNHAYDTTYDGIKMNHSSQLILLRLAASDRRALGKMLHDSGKLNDAAVAFREAALLLDESILVAAELSVHSTTEVDATSYLSEISTTNDEHCNMAVERATCRLHEALCLLKDGRPNECIAVCTDVLQDGATVIIPPLPNEKKDDVDKKQNKIEIAITPISRVKGSLKASHAKRSLCPANMMIPSQIRARAHHRRAKARLALRDLDGAYQDARCAAFLGDKNAVQFYGRLMREGNTVATSGACGGLASSPGEFLCSELGESSSSRGGVKYISPEVMATKHPFSSSCVAGTSNVFSSYLLNSLSSGVPRSNIKSNSSGDKSLFKTLIFNMIAQPSSCSEGELGRRRRGKKSSKGSSTKDGSAKSVFFSLMKEIEDERTQCSICYYLHSTSTQELMQYASLVGITMKEETARRLIDIAYGVTPFRIRKSLSKLKVGYSIFNTVRNTLIVINNCNIINLVPKCHCGTVSNFRQT
ncbi:hypothetical protein ACHAXA_003881 [Cyclostephanos tholiformis]|uniref:Uncharacterized protein n=1 Tax=Cyclostephanos tholiformis TaxID=382380 RepID=A0ABD3R1P3_9STRA